MNITDVEDKIIAKRAATGEVLDDPVGGGAPQELGFTYITPCRNTT